MQELTVFFPNSVDVMKDPCTVAWDLLATFNKLRPAQLALDQGVKNKAVVMVVDLEVGAGVYTAIIRTASVCELKILKRFELFGPKAKAVARSVQVFAKMPGNSAFGAVLRITDAKKKSLGIAVVCEPCVDISRVSAFLDSPPSL